MRLIGYLPDETQARRFASYLIVQGVAVRAELEGGSWALWIRDEDQVPQARDSLAEFQAAPTDPRYAKAEAEAVAKQREALSQQLAAQRNLIDMRTKWRSAHEGPRPLTMTIAAICAIIFLLTNAGRDLTGIMADLQFGPPGMVVGTAVKLIFSGEFWRLVTPIFVHLSVAHLIFNMMALFYLASPIERSQGTPRLGLLTLLLAVVSNVAQVWWTQRVEFGGLSGVIYGYLGYCWMSGQRDPTSALRISNETFGFWMIFFGLMLCQEIPIPGLQDLALKMFPPIANAAHTGGLVVGLALGFLAPWLPKRK